MNKENLQLVIDKIESDPESFNQKEWCGTPCCIAGQAQLLSGKSADRMTVKRDARLFLQLSEQEADYLFAGSRTIEDFKMFRDGSDGFDRAGFYRAGFYRDGRDRDGFYRDGRDRAGFDRDGRDRDGFYRDGRDRDGFYRDGLKLVDGVYKLNQK